MAAVARNLPGRAEADVVDVEADLSDPDAAARVIDSAQEAFGEIDVLVNNAAVDLAKPLLETTVDEAQRTFALNALGPLWMIQAAAPALARAGGGAIVNITSRLAHIGVPQMAVYGASKGALRALTHGAAIELAPMGIRVNAVAPGMTETPLFTEWISDQPDPTQARAEVEAKIPLGKLGAPADVASAVLFLAGEGASHITGTTLHVDGGYTAA